MGCTRIFRPLPPGHPPLSANGAAPLARPVPAAHTAPTTTHATATAHATVTRSKLCYESSSRADGMALTTRRARPVSIGQSGRAPSAPGPSLAFYNVAYSSAVACEGRRSGE